MKTNYSVILSILLSMMFGSYSASADIDESGKLQALFEAYDLDLLDTYPVAATFRGVKGYNHRFTDPIGKSSLAKYQALSRTYLSRIEDIDVQRLDGQDKLSQQIFRSNMKLNLQSFDFPSHYIPISQMQGWHLSYAQMGSGKGAQPFNSVVDYENFVKRTEGFVIYLDSVIAAMEQGIKAGVVLPQAIAEKIVPQLEAQIVQVARESIFYQPVNNFPETFSDRDKAKLAAEYENMIVTAIVPAYQRLKDFFINRYIPAARKTVGWSALPDGLAWYEHEVMNHTTLQMSAEAIHEVGLEEVDRILLEMEKVRDTVEFDGDLQAFFTYMREDKQFYFTTEEDLLAGYQAVKVDLSERIPKLFNIFPKADYEIRPVEKFRAASAAGASYRFPAADGSRPGIFYINTGSLDANPKYKMETLSIHESSPGHHLQISIQQELEGLPTFRRFGGYNAYTEGWALYAESLGRELGLFTDPYQWYGRLDGEQMRAMRLVVDTGLHAMGWSRQRAIDYMMQNSSMSLSDVTREVERYIALPGQALSYKLGERAIRKLRTHAEVKLKDRFDIREFHKQILIDGALPLPVLETKIEAWVRAQVENQKHTDFHEVSVID